MPKFVLSVSTNGRQRQISVHAPDEQSARREAEMDGHIVKDVALAMPDPVAPPRDPSADPKNKGFQLACGLLGVPGVLSLLVAAFGDPVWIIGSSLLVVVYFGLCVPRKATYVWNSFNSVGLAFLAVAACAIAMRYHGLVIYGEKLQLKPSELTVLIAGHVLGCAALLVLTFSKISTDAKTNTSSKFYHFAWISLALSLLVMPIVAPIALGLGIAGGAKGYWWGWAGAVVAVVTFCLWWMDLLLIPIWTVGA